MILVILAEHGYLAGKLELFILSLEVLAVFVEGDGVLEEGVVGVVVIRVHLLDLLREGLGVGGPAVLRDDGEGKRLEHGSLEVNVINLITKCISLLIDNLADG
jgi:hypothetical protein